MTKKLLLKALVINCTAIILAACVAHHPDQIYVDPLRKNPKIVFRDLTVPPTSKAATGIYSSKGQVASFKNIKTKKSRRH